MTKTWEQLTQSEKIEDLRKDVARIFKILTELRDAVAQDQSGLKQQIDGMKQWGPFLNDLQRRLEQIEKA
jgi:hypothetical protein